MDKPILEIPVMTDGAELNGRMPGLERKPGLTLPASQPGLTLPTARPDATTPLYQEQLQPPERDGATPRTAPRVLSGVAAAEAAYQAAVAAADAAETRTARATVESVAPAAPHDPPTLALPVMRIADPGAVVPITVEPEPISPIIFPPVVVVEPVVAPVVQPRVQLRVESPLEPRVELHADAVGAPEPRPAAFEVAPMAFPPVAAPGADQFASPRLIPTIGRNETRAAARAEAKAAALAEAEAEAAEREAVQGEALSHDETTPHAEDPGAARRADLDLIAALEEVIERNASDLHVTVGAPPRIRVDGSLQTIGGEAVWTSDTLTPALYSLLSDEQRERFEAENELDFAFSTGGARFRVNYYLQRGSIGGVFRLIPGEIRPLRDLGMPDAVAQFAGLPRGLVLVTGPTGSGKSTTLAALIDLVNRTRADHIVTVEDPIEFLHEHKMALVNQREVGHDTHSFASALKHVLRQDPDVILIGELRDLETISVALTAAETGHLVFATLHTQDAPQTIDRVIDVFPAHQQEQVRAQLAAALQGVVCQTLVKKSGGQGRVVASEVMMMTPAIANLIREGKTFQISSMMQAGRDLGMHTLDQSLADLVNRGQITRRAAEDKARDPEGLSSLINTAASPTEAAARAMAASEIDFGDSFSQVVR
ncbi:hypothetical protein GCM10027056_11090 [Glaciibacter psychrotolerans]